MLNVIDFLFGKWLSWRVDDAYQKANIEGKLQIKKFTLEDDAIETLLNAPDLVFLAEQAAKLLDDHQQDNFIQFDMLPKDDSRGSVRITIQWAHGESPTEQAERLERELDNLIFQRLDIHLESEGES